MKKKLNGKEKRRKNRFGNRNKRKRQFDTWGEENEDRRRGMFLNDTTQSIA